MYWNKQNKHHVFLFKNQEWLFKSGDIEYPIHMLFNRVDRLNKKVSKVSPRRHKQAARELIDRLLEGQNVFSPKEIGELDEIGELFEEAD